VASAAVRNLRPAKALPPGLRHGSPIVADLDRRRIEGRRTGP
jgi:hypothetical protein